MKIKEEKSRIRVVLLVLAGCVALALPRVIHADTINSERESSAPARAAMTTEDWQANDQFQAPATGIIPDVKPLSPLDQSNDPDKLQTTARIRQAIVSSPMFSQAAKNINIITTADGKVTLRGRVESEAELRNILDAAKVAAPGVSIENELRLQPTN